MAKRFLILWLVWWMPGIAAPRDIYTFSSAAQKQQFQQLTEELRCLVCQNESLADSTAPLAADLRREIYQKVQQGQSTVMIKNYLLQRYGQFILFKPAMNSLTYVLWFLPFILLLGVFVVSFVLLKRQKR